MPLFALYLMSRCDLFNTSCLSQITLMASLDVLWINLFNLKNKIMKLDYRKIFCGLSKVLKNTSWLINICLKYFMTPTKPFASSSFILNVCCLIYCENREYELFEYYALLLYYYALLSYCKSWHEITYWKTNRSRNSSNIEACDTIKTHRTEV